MESEFENMKFNTAIKNQIMMSMHRLKGTVEQLQDLYCKFPVLNKVQPDMRGVFAASLDEWFGNVRRAVEQWESIVTEQEEKKNIDADQKKFRENLAEICLCAGYNEARGSGDSREDIDTFIEWANEFEEKNKDETWDERDYILEIEAFAMAKLIDAGMIEAPEEKPKEFVGHLNTIMGPSGFDSDAAKSSELSEGDDDLLTDSDDAGDLDSGKSGTSAAAEVRPEDSVSIYEREV